MINQCSLQLCRHVHHESTRSEMREICSESERTTPSCSRKFHKETGFHFTVSKYFDHKASFPLFPLPYWINQSCLDESKWVSQNWVHFHMDILLRQVNKIPNYSEMLKLHIQDDSTHMLIFPLRLPSSSSPWRPPPSPSTPPACTPPSAPTTPSAAPAPRPSSAPRPSPSTPTTPSPPPPTRGWPRSTRGAIQLNFNRLFNGIFNRAFSTTECPELC